ncbi:MAG: alpha/beta fold hydrolase, partial [Bdellovibrionota bacterium]
YFGGVWTEAYNENLAPLAGWLNGPDSRLIAWDRALISDMIFTQPIVQELPQIQVPTLLVIGQRDRTAIGKDRANAVEAAMLGNYPALGKSAAKAIPHSQLVEILTAGHLPQVDNFATYIQAVVNFLGKE